METGHLTRQLKLNEIVRVELYSNRSSILLEKKETSRDAWAQRKRPCSDIARR